MHACLLVILHGYLCVQVGYGYRIGRIGDTGKHFGTTDWAAQLPAMEEVTAQNLKYDLEDARRFKVPLCMGVGAWAWA